MKISLDNALGLHPDALKLRADRTGMLARNLANADTPGFKARDIDFQQTLARRMEQTDPGMRVRTTHQGHQTPSVSALEGETRYRLPNMPSLDGNTVDVQMEQAEFAENNMQFLASLRFVNGRLSGMMSAIRGE